MLFFFSFADDKKKNLETEGKSEFSKMNMNVEVDTTEWDAICRVCLQEGTLHSIFDYDDENSELNIAEKVMLCSPIKVRFLCILSVSVYVAFMGPLNIELKKKINFYSADINGW